MPMRLKEVTLDRLVGQLIFRRDIYFIRHVRASLFVRNDKSGAFSLYRVSHSNNRIYMENLTILIYCFLI